MGSKILFRPVFNNIVIGSVDSVFPFIPITKTARIFSNMSATPQ